MAVVAMLGGFALLLVGLALWARKKHREYRDIYSMDPSASRHPPFLERLFDGFHGGQGPRP